MVNKPTYHRNTNVYILATHWLQTIVLFNNKYTMYKSNHTHTMKCYRNKILRVIPKLPKKKRKKDIDETAPYVFHFTHSIYLINFVTQG